MRLAFLVVAALGLVGCGMSGTTTIIERHSTELAATKQRVVAPYGLDGKPSAQFTVTETLTGSCWTGSLADFRSDAWRCTSGSEIIDPCFSGTNSPPREVLCPESPFGKEVTALTLSKELPVEFADEGTAGEEIPWGLRLANGAECLQTPGGNPEVGGSRVNYYCDRDGYLVGDVDRSPRPWTILQWDGHGSRLRPVAIAEAAW
jgi:hypothetical protein